MGKFRKKPVVIEAVKVPLREYADLPMVFAEAPEWLQDAVARQQIRAEFRSEGLRKETQMASKTVFVLANSDGTPNLESRSWDTQEQAEVDAPGRKFVEVLENPKRG
jgi:hypothetical protein